MGSSARRLSENVYLLGVTIRSWSSPGFCFCSMVHGQGCADTGSKLISVSLLLKQEWVGIGGTPVFLTRIPTQSFNVQAWPGTPFKREAGPECGEATSSSGGWIFVLCFRRSRAAKASFSYSPTPPVRWWPINCWLGSHSRASFRLGSGRHARRGLGGWTSGPQPRSEIFQRNQSKSYCNHFNNFLIF